MSRTPFQQVPRDPIIDRQGKMSPLWQRWFEDVWRKFSQVGQVAWSLVNKAGSDLADLEARQHGDLTDLGEDDHLQYHNNTRGDARYYTKSEVDTAIDAAGADLDDHIADTSTHGVTGDVVGTTDAQVVSGKKFGGDTHYSEFEDDGTLHFAGDATVWKDIKFPMAPPKTTGAGNPTLTTYNGNMRAFAFAVNDAHDFNPEEIDHDAKIGSTATWHVHFLSRSNDGTDRGVKWEIEYAIEPASGALPAPTTISAELTIPAGTAVNTVQRLDIGTFTVPTIARLAYARIKRVAAVGTAPSVDPILSALHFHYELDTVGSREILTK